MQQPVICFNFLEQRTLLKETSCVFIVRRFLNSQSSRVKALRRAGDAFTEHLKTRLIL
jgi:hypothetical protein